MSDAPPIPARALPVSARAPGKCILFGEHAVVHGAPELAVAIDLHTQVVVSSSSETRLNGSAGSASENPYLAPALGSGGPTFSTADVRSVSRIPRAAGLGSSAAFVAAVSTAVAAVNGGVPRAVLAQRAFEAERRAQEGVGSPGDTTTSVAGGYVTLNAGPEGGEPLWTVTADSATWEVRRPADPGWSWVVAYSGIRRSTADAVRAVAERLAEPDGPALLDRFAAVARAGIRAVVAGDREAAGAELTRNQGLLREVGVSHPRLEALLEAAAPAALGAKLTGAGRGGSIVALPIPGREVELVRRLARAGAVPFPVRPASGAELIDAPPP